MIRPLSEAERAANWQAVRRNLRRYALAIVALALWAIHAAGYWSGYFDGTRDAAAAKQHKESNNER